MVDDEIDIVKIVGCTFAVVAIVIIVLACVYWPQTTIRPAGVVNDLQLHETTFSTVTTVETSEGWYQTEAAVSASKGDAVTIKARGSALQICIDSKDRPSCYPVL